MKPRFSAALLFGMAVFVACVDNSSNSPPGALPGAQGLDGSAPDVGSVPQDGAPNSDAQTSQNDAGAKESGGDVGDAFMPTEGGQDASLNLPSTTRIGNLGNLGPATLDLCVKDSADPAFGQPILRSLGIAPVPNGMLSKHFVMPPFVSAVLRAVDGAATTCDTPITSGDFAGTVNFGPGRIYLFLSSNAGGAIARVENDSPAPNAAKQAINFLGTTPPYDLMFGQTHIFPADFGPTPFEDAGSDTFTATPNAGPALTRSFAAVAGGVATVYVNTPETALIVCDDLAQPAGDLSSCN